MKPLLLGPSVVIPAYDQSGPSSRSGVRFKRALDAVSRSHELWATERMRAC